jgi:Domain of unknown function (DUF4398)
LAIEQNDTGRGRTLHVIEPPPKLRGLALSPLGEFDMSEKPNTDRLPLWRLTVIGVAGTLLASACASTPPAPTADLQSAAQAIATADQARIPDTTAPELGEARDKLAAAQAAVAAQHMQEADRLALESRADAELASATSQASKDQSINDEIVRSTATLSQEMQRNKGTAQ